FGRVDGLPSYAPIGLKEAVLAAAELLPNLAAVAPQGESLAPADQLLDDVEAEDLVVGGDSTRDLLRACLRQANSQVVIHSCFVHPEVIRNLLPDFEEAAKRKVRIDLLWGLNVDPEDPSSMRPISEVRELLNQSSDTSRARVQLSPVSSGSHAKIILYDERHS